MSASQALRATEAYSASSQPFVTPVTLGATHLGEVLTQFTPALVAGSAMHCFHMNDYPATPPRETIRDADRVYPGDGIGPLTQILRDLAAAGFRGTLSLELFNPTYWKQDPLAVARTGLAKMKEAVEKAVTS